MNSRAEKSCVVDHAENEVLLLEQVTPIAEQINCLDMEKIADVCINYIPKVIGVRVASLYVLDDAANMLHLYKHNHPHLLNKLVSLNQTPPTPMVLAVKSRELIIVEDINTYTKPLIKRSQRPYAKNYQTNGCVIVPLVCQQRVIGVLNLADRKEPGEFSKKNIAIIKLLSQLIGASIGNIKLFERIQHQATTDGLTGLVNHKSFYEILERELWRLNRYGGQISLIMIDIDNLKEINDGWGHRIGDKVIKEVSLKIKACIRQIDTAARYGGDEFAVILPNTALNEAKTASERMLKAVSDTAINVNGKQIPLSISIGLGEYDSNNSPEDVTSGSDSALYKAKQAGKNTIRIFKAFEKHV